MALEGVATDSVVEDDLQRQRETVLRRYEAGAWLRKMVGVVVGKDLPAQPSEDDFRLGLRSGIILCKVLNKVKPQSVAKVVEAPGDSILIPDGEALSAYKYFENVRNFLVSVKEMGLPTFETSDLEKGGKSCRIVNCVLALKSYKEAGGSLSGKVGENQKVTSSSKQFARKITDLFSSSLSRSPSLSREMSTGSVPSEDFSSGGAGLVRSPSLSAIVHELLVHTEQEDMRDILENSLSKVMEEFEHRLALQKEQVEQEHRLAIQKEHVEQEHRLALLKEQMEQAITHQKERQIVNESTSRNEEATSREGESCNSKEDIQKTELKCQSVKQQMLVDRHKKDIQELKSVLNATKTDMHLLKTTYEEEVSNLGKHLNGLTDAASGYKKVIEENRKLYNLVQDLKGSIRVYCRVRPFLHVDAGGVNSVDRLDDESITVIEPSKNGKDKSKSFTFNKVFGPSATQEEVFADTQPLVRSVLDGYNVCIFAYGQTGSGKTHTMSGPNDLTKETMGVNYRALNDLFHISEQRKHLSAYDISVQMIEIYNEQVRDLLVTDGTNKRLEIHNNSPNGINVPDANIVSVSSPSDVINLMSLGHNNRAVGSTAMNDRSSRSHSCLTVHVQGRDLTSGTALRGCMHLVDLAGSERLDKTEAVGDRLKEAQHINKSLSALGDVIASLAQKNAHVPYRNSKLTQLLQDSLGGQAKTLMFVHISPEPDAVGETISTLKFAERVSSVELGAAKSNRESSELRELKEQNSRLKAALARKDGETLSSSSSHASLKSFDGLSDRRLSMDGLNDRRQSMDGLSDRRQSIGGSSDRRQSMGGVSNRRQSLGGSSDRRQSLGGVSDRRQLLGGSSERRQSLGGVSDRRQSLGGSSDRRQSLGGASDHRQSLGGSSDRRQSLGGVSDRRQSLGGSSDRRQSSGGLSDRKESMGSSSDRRESIGGSSERKQSIGTSDRRESMGGSSDRRQSRDGSESIEVKSNSSVQGLDLDLISWPVIGNPLPRGDGKDIVPGDWVDKVMINKCDPRSGDNFQGRLQNETGRPPKISNPKYTPNPSKKYPAKSQDTRKVANSTRSARSASYDGRKKTNNSK